MADPKLIDSKMEKIVALCKRRGFIFQSSEIYGGINGFWDYGPLGVELKRNLKEAWWQDMVRRPNFNHKGELIEMVGVDCAIIMNPKTWVASGHVGGFSDPMVDCRETKNRYRADHLLCAEMIVMKAGQQHSLGWLAVQAGDEAEKAWAKKAEKILKKQGGGEWIPPSIWIPYSDLSSDMQRLVVGPDTDAPGTLTEPRQFNLMFKTLVGAIEDPSAVAYLRPETAQGIFANFRNVLDTSRVKVPFGMAQIGKAFRNEVTPRHFIFRSREFEQMEIEFFVHPSEAHEWYAYWCQSRYQWWQSIGLSNENLRLRPQEQSELAHYAKEGAGSSDVEYRFPFTDPGFGELEGIAHRTDYDLRQHAEHSGQGDRLKYFDQETQERYFPHIIEPSAGADRGVLALLCEAYVEDPSRPSGLFMRFHPRMAPIKAGIFPLVDKEGMPEIARNLYLNLKQKWNVQLDVKQNIGKRYARMDEAGTPFCFTVDTQTLSDQTVTVRYRDTLLQQRLSLGQVPQFLNDQVESCDLSS
ncbi:glycine--tRNA ligase [Candidatus Protochlamydia phocaeensis]|uniref:glycine--tRNA ligase n=1 Tax=Candidatus Protochlamydia phocaeensis TaxID=1414722 RepID=UPI0008398E79|nr:glycine--tRNA ligase [Candidatus Protochlamydia phocaeensis]